MANIKNNAVLSTNDYSLFKRVGGNRVVSDKHVIKLQEAMKRLDLKIPIITNENMEVIDGQHRLEARKRLKFPVYYTIIEGLGLHETQVANANNKNWTLEDFAHSFAEQNYHSYKELLKFKQRFQFPLSECMTILSGYSDSGKANPDFREGKFYAKDVEKANDIGVKIYQVQPFYKGFKRRSFIRALITCFKTEGYDHEDFLQKLSYQSSKLVDCTSVEQYLHLIDEIYNFKRKIEDKIRFI